MQTYVTDRHPQSPLGAVVFPNHTRTVKGKLYVRDGDDYYHTKQPSNGAYPIIDFVTRGTPEYAEVALAFVVPLYATDSPRSLKRAA